LDPNAAFFAASDSDGCGVVPEWRRIRNVGFANRPRLAPDLGYDGLSNLAKLVADGSAKRSQE
jgi:hypothetical protein